MLANLKKSQSDRQLINEWLDHIHEFDQDCRNEVIEQCVRDIEARRYYVMRYEDYKCKSQPVNS